MQRFVRTLAAVTLTAGIVVWMGGCPGTTSADDTGDSTGDALSNLEQDAIDAAQESAAALAQGMHTAQSISGGDNQSSLVAPAGTQTLAFGSCPEVTMSLAGAASLFIFSATIDYGTAGCAPFGTSRYACTGSATGTFNQQDNTLDIGFQNIRCDGAALDGTIAGAWERSATSVGINGDFDLTWSNGDVSVSTTGTGTGTYDINNQATALNTFTGTTSDGTHTYNVTMTGIMMSFPTYERFMPYAGQITLSGTDIRTYIVRFNENSPTTGVVVVSIQGAPFVEVNLYAAGGAS
jgi:hypothetical protein